MARICIISVNKRALGINIRLCELSIKSVDQAVPIKLLKAMALHIQDPRVLLAIHTQGKIPERMLRPTAFEFGYFYQPPCSILGLHTP